VSRGPAAVAATLLVVVGLVEMACEVVGSDRGGRSSSSSLVDDDGGGTSNGVGC
jgi:hypothetical protein